jgi:3-hydroxyisobutyrate dehydrogenase-like beta-hydroxyacid dehydrogenase
MLKLIANYLLMTGVASLAEAVALGQTTDVQAGLLREFLSTIPTVAPGLHNRLDDVLTGDHQGWFTTRLGAKDVRLFEEVATAAGLDVPIAALVRSRYEEASDTRWDTADWARWWNYCGRADLESVVHRDSDAAHGPVRGAAFSRRFLLAGISVWRWP